MTSSSIRLSEVRQEIESREPFTQEHELQSIRPEFLLHTYRSTCALLEPIEPRGLSHRIREICAYRVAFVSRCQPLIDFHDQRLVRLGLSASTIAAIQEPQKAASLSMHEKLILDHVDRLVLYPGTITKLTIQNLVKNGLTDYQLVVITQLTGFMCYYVRVVYCLNLVRS